MSELLLSQRTQRTQRKGEETGLLCGLGDLGERKGLEIQLLSRKERKGAQRKHDETGSLRGLGDLGERHAVNLESMGVNGVKREAR